MSNILNSMSRASFRKHRRKGLNAKRSIRMEHSDRVTVAEKFRFRGGSRPYVRCANGQVRRAYRDAPKSFFFTNCGQEYRIA